MSPAPDPTTSTAAASPDRVGEAALVDAVGLERADRGGPAADGGDSGGLSPITAMSLRDQARRAIRAGIIAGNIEAGEVISVRALASRLGVSATPVREAVLDLAKEGLLLAIRNKGFQVPTLSDQDLQEILDIRLLLEVPAMVRLAGRLSEERGAYFRAMVAAIGESASAGDIVGFLEGDREFHLSLLGELGNQRLTDVVALLRDQVRLYGVPHLAEEHQLAASAEEHAALLEAVEGGDRRLAEQLMARHLRHTRGIWAGAHERGHGASWSPSPKTSGRNAKRAPKQP
jgi:DNA-binding GntR family transcriptional regulator